jgi:hypothetical protein
MRFLFVLLLFSNLKAFTQNKIVELSINILPELKEDFTGKEIHLYGLRELKLDTSLQYPYFLRIVCDKKQEVQLFADAHIELKKSGIYKNFNSFISTTSTDSVVELNMTFPFDCSHNKNSKQKICPVCKKNDEVIPILYGLMGFDAKGNSFFKDYGEFMPGGCNVSPCDPTWYCKRDDCRF